MRTTILLILLFLGNTSIASTAVPWQLSLQEAASPIMQELNEFHDLLLIICFSIVAFVFALLTYVCIRFSAKNNPIPNKFTHNITIEIIWTIIPIIILVIIAFPSFRILKLMNTTPNTELTIKVVGHQWYWHYQYPDHNIEFDSYMIDSKNLTPNQKRLLDVDNPLIVPENTNIKFLITAADVIHSFAIPSLGLKTDAVNGRVNETWTKIIKQGTYYGQCSELCGINHGFMPIVVKAVSKEEFESWISKQQKALTSNLQLQHVSAK